MNKFEKRGSIERRSVARSDEKTKRPFSKKGIKDKTSPCYFVYS